MKLINQKTLIWALGVISAIMAVVIIILAVRKAPDPDVTSSTYSESDEVTETIETPVKPASNPKTATTVAAPVVSEPASADSKSSTEALDGYAIKVIKQPNGTYTAAFDPIEWKYNPDLAMSVIVNSDTKTRTFDLDKNVQISYVSNWQYSPELDRRDVFLDIVNYQKLGRGQVAGTNLYHVIIKNDTVVSMVEIYRS